MDLRYDPSWAESVEGRPLSLSLPISLDGSPLRGDRVRFYFDNLLPESEPIRRRIQARFHTDGTDAFALLQAVGRDCIGAVQLLPEGHVAPNIKRIEAEPLSDAEIERHLLAATGASFADIDEDDFRISLAGAQEKTAFTRHNGRWCKPHGATPTTHIFKLALGRVGHRQLDMTTSIENEWLCGQILAAFGLPTARSEIRQFGATKVLVVDRFDRQLHASKKYWLRLPQEDFCQATGTPSSHKYEADGGPGLPDLAAIVQGSESRDEDLRTLLRAQILFWMLAATDGHAKNFSLRMLAGGRYRMTPLYDVLSSWPITGKKAHQIDRSKLKLAMALRGKSKHYRVADIHRRHFDETARACGYGEDMKDLVDEMVENAPQVVDDVSAVLPKGFPGHVFDSITKGLRESAEKLARMS